MPIWRKSYIFPLEFFILYSLKQSNVRFTNHRHFRTRSVLVLCHFFVEILLSSCISYLNNIKFYSRYLIFLLCELCNTKQSFVLTVTMPVEPINDPSITIKPTPKLIEFVLKQMTNIDNAPPGIIALKTSNKRQRPDIQLKLKDIKWLNGYLEEYRKSSKEKVYLHELLEGADINLPTPKVTPRNAELEARIQKLTIQQNAREYEAMTKSVDVVRKRFPEDTIAYQMKEINKQLIAVVQFVFSVLAGFAFGFIGVELIVGNLDFGFRLLLGIICALIIALAEIYFLAKKLNEDIFDEIPPMPIYRKLHQE